MSEFSRIADFFAPLAAPEVALGLRDDAAIIAPDPDHIWVITTDAIAEGVHYIGSESPNLIARKLLRCNLSDLAAKGATPRYYTLNIMLPKLYDDAWVKRFAEGLAIDQKHYGIQLIGGDSIAVTGEKACVSATLFGTIAKPKKPMLRSGARVNDLICISGTLGDAALYLKKDQYSLRDVDLAYFEERYALPEPRLRLGEALLGIASSCMDISDGLVQDVGHIAEASGGVGIFINAVDIPLSAAFRHIFGQYKDEQEALMRLALAGGDDYELLFTIAEHDFERAQTSAHLLGVEISPIGRVVQEKEIKVIGLDGKVMHIEKGGYSHG